MSRHESGGANLGAWDGTWYRLVVFTLAGALICAMGVFALQAFAPVQTGIIDTASAAGKLAVKTLKQNKSYKIKICGKKAKKVRWKRRTLKRGSRYQFRLYVGGKCVFKRAKHRGSLYEYVSKVRSIDINTKDKYRELICRSSFGQSDSFVFILRYMGAKKVKTYGYNHFKDNPKRLPYRIDASKIVNTGKNEFYIAADTPYGTQTGLGCYWTFLPVKLTAKKIVRVKKASYKIIWQARTLKYAYAAGTTAARKHYILSRSVRLYSDASFDEPTATLYSGTSLDTLRVTPYAKSDGDWSIFVKVKTVGGKTGWIYLPVSSSYNYFTYIGLWG